MRHLRRFIGAMIVTIAFLAASSAAQAHGGHDHVASAETQTSAAQDAHGVSSKAQDAASVGNVSTQMETRSHPDGRTRCLGGCCSSAHMCCAINLPAWVSEIFPAHSGASRLFAQVLLRDGLSPGALRKPPRSFA